MTIDNILKSIARVLGINSITAEDAQAKLDAMLSFEELKANAKSEIEADFNKKISALEAEKSTLTSEKETLENEVLTLKAKVTELEKRSSATHTTGATEITKSDNAEESAFNQRLSSLRAHKEKFNY